MRYILLVLVLLIPNTITAQVTRPGTGPDGTSSAKIIATSGENVSVGELVAIDDSDGSPRIYKADANGGTERVNPIGIAASTATPGAPLYVMVAGECPVADSEWDAVPGVADVGKRVYLSEMAGNWTLTAPSATGSMVIRTGIITRGGAGMVKVVLQIGEGVVL